MDGDDKPCPYLVHRGLQHKMKSCENELNSRLSLVIRLEAYLELLGEKCFHKHFFMLGWTSQKKERGGQIVNYTLDTL